MNYPNCTVWVDGVKLDTVANVELETEPDPELAAEAERANPTGGFRNYSIRIVGLEAAKRAMLHLDRCLRRMMKRRRRRLKMRKQGIPHRRDWKRLGSKMRRLCRTSTRQCRVAR